MRALWWCVVFAALMFLPRAAHADVARLPTFYELSEQKVKLVVKSEQLQNDIATTQKRIKEVSELEAEKLQLDKDWDTAQGDLNALKKIVKPDDAQQRALQTATFRSEGLASDQRRMVRALDGDTTAALQLELVADNAALTKTNDELADVQARILSILTPEQDFKKTISGYFAALIGAVIIGFFAITASDRSVKRAIFSGQSGIQFVTLFSLVIAIILFGVTGILEGKELSALLGGLSGYILGRVTQRENGTSTTEVPGPPANLQLKSAGGVITATCASATTASVYNWFVKVAGKDTVFRFLADSVSPTATLQDATFTTGDSVTVQVTATNLAGQGPPSKAGSVTVA